MEMKWFAVMVIGGIIAVAVGYGIERHYTQRCVDSMTSSSRSADDIAKLCQIPVRGGITISDKNAK